MANSIEETITNILQRSVADVSQKYVRFEGHFNCEVDGEPKHYSWSLSLDETPDPDDMREGKLDIATPRQTFGYYK